MSIEALTPFLSEMRKELAQTVPEFEKWTQTLASAPAGDPQVQDALDGYASQVERIGQTAELIGMPGLNSWCQSFNGILPAVVGMEGDARAQACQQLLAWPALVDTYLQEPANFDASMALAEFLAAPSFSQPFSEENTLRLIESLTTPPVVPEELVAQLSQAEAPASVTVEDTSLAVPESADHDVYSAFLDEAPGNVEQFSELTSKIAAGKATMEDLRSAKRIAHSFKGAANIVGIRGIAALGHHTEDVLEYFEKNPVTPPRALGRSLVAASDCLAQMVGYLRGDESAPENAFEVLSEIVGWANKVKTGEIAEMAEEAVVEAPVAHEKPVQPAAPAAPAAEGELQATLRVPVSTVDELFRLTGEMTTMIARLESQVGGVTDRAKALIEHNFVLQQRVGDVEKLVMVRGLSLARQEAEKNASFDPLEMDRYTELHGLTRTLVEATADARAMVDSLEAGVANLRVEVSQQANINRELQYQVIATRLAPVNVLNGRLMRNVRQTCQQTGKQAELVITGGEIQVDGDVLNKLADPLLHVLRNAVDHGTEPPDERIAAGKPAVGRIDLEFTRHGSGIVVKIRDDGKGLDYPRIRKKAIEKKLIKPEQQLTHAELARLVLLPGFSTRDQVSEISGRGVGMDVVASRLANIKGTVELNSEPGHGTEIVLRFQASLVTQHTLLVETGKQIFAIPAHYIKEAFPSNFGKISLSGGTEWQLGEWQFTVRDQSFPVHELATLTGFPSPPESADRFSAMPKILIHTMSGAVAVLVDRLVDSRSVMVKSIGKYLQHVHGISGVTLLGDGTVVPLLNVPELLAEPVEMTAAAVAELAASARARTKRILVVDDSLSVRRGLVQLLQDAGYEVKGAGDGMDAIRVLASFKPQLVCTDMEMPNMNGLELTEHLRMWEATRDLPVIMITSRSMEKHRQQAMKAGVNAYLTKPYTEAELLGHIQKAFQASGSQTETVPA